MIGEQLVKLFKNSKFVDIATSDFNGRPNAAPKYLLKIEGEVIYLADYVNKSLIGCYRSIPPKTKECLIEDLEQIKQKDPDKDGKIAITPKQEIKENLGRSNDYSAAMAMRMLFVIQKENKLFDLAKIEEAFKW